MADISQFATQIKGDVVTEKDADYMKAIARWAANAQRNAKVVVFVKDEDDIAATIKYAKDNALPIAIRGGGHNPAGASSTDGGVVIDLSRYLNGTKVDAEKKLAYVGGGALWETVDKAAIEHGLATVGGTVNHTGVAGLLLGGGYGWLSAAHGLVIDNLVQATLVTADGSSITASETENADLFFGIRGGGCNFGVATEFVLKLYLQRRTVYSGVMVFAPPALEKLVAVTKEWFSHAGQHEGMIQIATVGPDGNPAVVAFPFYNGTEAEGRNAFRAFLDIGPVADMTKEIPYEELNALQNPQVHHGNGVYMKGVAHKNINFQLISKAFDKVIEIAKGTGLRPAILYEYFPLSEVTSVSASKTAFRRDPASSILVILAWDGDVPDKSDQARSLAYEIAGIVTGGQSEAINTESLGYSNYDPEGVSGGMEAVTDKAKLVFGDNYPKLQEIKKKYDPKNIFNKWFPITPAV
ncbi:hypothetical protein BDQ12DRAFT_731314 [Crucibulum laeve]|uniref:FAD-binding PCMH-type domain-containing protein n=1 Tax=Crucibulum laeve TaxID=68775 RepID=A0A5C3MF62_9AGAR|nr:hypothetical protein BDQ12DRAFT_731314 [Crucibulum laeve]